MRFWRLVTNGNDHEISPRTSEAWIHFMIRMAHPNIPSCKVSSNEAPEATNPLINMFLLTASAANFDGIGRSRRHTNVHNRVQAVAISRSSALNDPAILPACQLPLKSSRISIAEPESNSGKITNLVKADKCLDA